MAQKTSLSLYGGPGRVLVFSAKTPTGGAHPVAWITELGLGAYPGGRHTFTAKAPPSGGGPHDPGRITALTLYGISGQTISFTAKKAPPLPPPVRRQFYTLRKSTKSAWRVYTIEED